MALAPALGGARPWLGPASWINCDQINRLLIRTASNAYFSQKMSVISLPKRNETVKKAVDQAWQFLEAVESAGDVAYERKKAKVKAVIEDFTDGRKVCSEYSFQQPVQLELTEHLDGLRESFSRQRNWLEETLGDQSLEMAS